MPGWGVGCGISVLKRANSRSDVMEAGTFGYPRERSF
jgi:hypothetical protein